MCLCIVVSLCELEHEYMEYVFVYCCVFVWVRTRIHGVCVWAQTHTPCIRVLNHTKKQQYTNVYSMYSCSNSHKDTTIHKHILHVFVFQLTQRYNNAQTHTPCIRVLTHTKKQQYTNVYSMYSCSNSHKETTMHKHILHVFVCVLLCLCVS
jgi:predicted nucleotidyltransferase